MKSNIIAILDIDVFAHIACKNPSERVQAFRGIYKNDKRYKALKPEEIVWSDAEAARYIEESWKAFKYHVKSTLEFLYTSDYLGVMKGKNNYRDIIHPGYKGHRKLKKYQYDFPSIVRDMAFKEGYGIRADGRESDDYLRIWANEASKAGYTPVICSNDKDLNCIPGKHLNVKKNLFYEVNELDAARFYHKQLLMGDSTDAIPGIPGCGPKTADSSLDTCETEAEMQETVAFMYYEHYGEDFWDALLFNGKLIYIQDTENSHFGLSDWPSALEIREMVKAKKAKPLATPTPPAFVVAEPVVPKSKTADFVIPRL